MNDIYREQLKTELLESFSLYADPEYNEGLLPVSKIIFSAQGDVTSPPDLEFMGYGGGPEGDAFDTCGGINLEGFFPLDSEGDYSEDTEECFYKASAAVVSALQSVATSDKFLAIPKRGPIVFVLDLEEQVTKVLCRIHPDGSLELPPAKKG